MRLCLSCELLDQGHICSVRQRQKINGTDNSFPNWYSKVATALKIIICFRILTDNWSPCTWKIIRQTFLLESWKGSECNKGTSSLHQWFTKQILVVDKTVLKPTYNVISLRYWNSQFSFWKFFISKVILFNDFSRNAFQIITIFHVYFVPKCLLVTLLPLLQPYVKPITILNECV